MNNNLVTVVIPAYNHQDYVQDTILSIIKQTHKNIELVIYNDGSIDKTDIKIRELLAKCRKRFARFEYISKPNEGLAATLNRAIDWASSDYLYIIASDDVAMKNAVKKLYRFLSTHKDYALAVGDNQIINSKGRRCYWDEKRNFTEKKEAVYHTFGEFLSKKRNDFRFESHQFGSYETLIRGNYIVNGKMIRIKALIHVGKYRPDMKLEDWYMNLQLAKFYKMKYINKILLSYRWHDANTIKKPDYANGTADQAVLDFEKKTHPEWFNMHKA